MILSGLFANDSEKTAEFTATKITFCGQHGEVVLVI